MAYKINNLEGYMTQFLHFANNSQHNSFTAIIVNRELENTKFFSHSSSPFKIKVLAVACATFHNASISFITIFNVAVKKPMSHVWHSYFVLYAYNKHKQQVDYLAARFRQFSPIKCIKIYLKQSNKHKEKYKFQVKDFILEE